VWNLALGPGRLALFPSSAKGDLTLDRVASIGCLVFVLLAIRESLLETEVTFADGALRIRTNLAPWLRLELPLRDLSSFEVLEREDATYEVEARREGAPDVKLPLSFETVPIKASWTRRAPFASPVTYASFLARRLNAMLASARGFGA